MSQITDEQVQTYKKAYSEALTSLLNIDCGGDIGFEATRIALASLSHTMGVKGLEWTRFEKTRTGYERWEAETITGKWWISVQEDGYHLRSLHSKAEIVFPTLGSAQAGAQADCETRIRSALTPTQQPVAWRWRFEVDGPWYQGSTDPAASKFMGGKPVQIDPLYALASPQAVPGWEKEREVLRKALTLAEGRIALLLEAYPDESDGCDHPTATRYVLSEIRAALNAEVSKS